MMLQKTFSAKKDEIVNNWFVVDAAGRVLGRFAADIARILQGKHKPQYTPHMDTGDNIIVINADKVKISGKKAMMKVYRHHSGYIGGLKEIPYETMMARKPEDIIKHAVWGMMPKSKLSQQMFKKLKVYAGPEHDHVAQKPAVLEL